jgi:Ca-activated chloride channel family protein
VAKADVHRSRIFVFGVGHDVNTRLLDRVATEHRGTSVYVGENEDLERALSGFYEKIASPVLSDLSVEFRGVEVSRVYPKALPDLFKGSQLVIVGRYTGRGPVTAVLTGRADGQVRRFVLEGARTGSGGRSSFLPRLWATRRVGDLLEEVRLRGSNPELVAEIERLGLKYGIVTPYTSFLVTEREAERLDAAAPAAREAVLGGVVGGVGAVRAAKATLAFKNEDRPAQAVSERILYKDDKTFYLRDGVWTDSEHTEGARLTEIAFDSDEFYKLLAAKPGLAKYLSIGRNVVVVFERVTYRIVE